MRNEAAFGELVNEMIKILKLWPFGWRLQVVVDDFWCGAEYHGVKLQWSLFNYFNWYFKNFQIFQASLILHSTPAPKQNQNKIKTQIN